MSLRLDDTPPPGSHIFKNMSGKSNCRRSSRPVKKKEDSSFEYVKENKLPSKATLKKRKQREMKQQAEVVFYDQGDDTWSKKAGGVDGQFYTERRNIWLRLIFEDLQEKYKEGKINAQPEIVDTAEYPQIKLKKNEDSETWRVTIKFFPTGFVVVQGKNFRDWCVDTFPILKGKTDSDPIAIKPLQELMGSIPRECSAARDVQHEEADTAEPLLSSSRLPIPQSKNDSSPIKINPIHELVNLSPGDGSVRGLLQEETDTGGNPRGIDTDIVEDPTTTADFVTIENMVVNMPKVGVVGEGESVARQKGCEEVTEEPVFNQLFQEIERLNGELAQKKSELKVSSANLKSAECEISSLKKEITVIKKGMEKQKKELRKTQNSKDNIIKEKLAAKSELEQAAKQIDALRKFNKNTKLLYNIDTTVTWAEKLANCAGQEVEDANLPTSQVGKNPGKKVNSGKSNLAPVRSNQNRHDQNQRSDNVNATERGRLQEKKAPQKGRRNTEPSDLLLIGDFVLKGISAELDVDSTAYINPGADANSMKERMPSQIEDRKFTLIQCGSNNLQEELRTSIPALGNMIDVALQATTGHILINAIPWHLFEDKHNDLTKRINMFLKHRCGRNKEKRLHFVNCNPAPDEINYARNGLHFNESGRKIFAAQLKSTLSTIRNFAPPPQEVQA